MSDPAVKPSTYVPTLDGWRALSIALVDDQKVVWARGYGFQDPKRKTPATARTVYRVGSVSKLFPDLALARGEMARN